jgi:hypothetical protein
MYMCYVQDCNKLHKQERCALCDFRVDSHRFSVVLEEFDTIFVASSTLKHSCSAF